MEDLKENIENMNLSPIKKIYVDIVEIADAIIFAIVFSILMLTLVFRTGYVSGESMENTFHDADRYIVSSLFYSPKQNDIVVFQPFHNIWGEDERLWVKRVIATEGQTVDIDPVSHTVYVEGKELTEPYIYGQTLLISQQFPITVPKGHVFVMGDNRNPGCSRDSRDASVGCIDTRRIVGHVIFRFYPFDKMGIV